MHSQDITFNKTKIDYFDSYNISSKKPKNSLYYFLISGTDGKTREIATDLFDFQSRINANDKKALIVKAGDKVIENNGRFKLIEKAKTDEETINEETKDMTAKEEKTAKKGNKAFVIQKVKRKIYVSESEEKASKNKIKQSLSSRTLSATPYKKKKKTSEKEPITERVLSSIATTPLKGSLLLGHTKNRMRGRNPMIGSKEN